MDYRYWEQVIDRHPRLAVCTPDVLEMFHLLRETFEAGGKVLICGNGGSASDAEHMTAELMKGFALPRPLPSALSARFAEVGGACGAALSERLQLALPAWSLVSQTALLTAVSNDLGPELAFAQQVLGYGQAGDALIGFSTSGRSANVCNAAIAAKALGLHTIAISGGDGGELVRYCDKAILAPGGTTAEIQEGHLPIYHGLCLMLEHAFFGGSS